VSVTSSQCPRPRNSGTSADTHAAAHLYRTLLQQNQALRAKEEQQLKLLGWYDAWSRSVKSEQLPGHDADEPCASTQSDSSSALPAPERLERQSQRLLNSLRPQAELQDTAAGPTQPSVNSAEGSCSSSGAAASTAAGSTPEQGSGASATDALAGAAGEDDHMTRWFSQIDPAELAIHRSMTPDALAGETACTTCRTAVCRIWLHPAVLTACCLQHGRCLTLHHHHSSCSTYVRTPSVLLASIPAHLRRVLLPLC
jgi:hypothetical protein